ncbi:cytochrome P450 family protein [Nocardia aurantiaca]|uniref:Cytochrome P450 n=1 Tax=Nocardia aurantiaca TaxID=2675850 RepID=A0A6I3KX49_9NOCA|nr:cytochrome P450 [Nocardia aurantiaca]MTE13448.1 cytochrome P450 [Nocardia aurantiaca]
MRLHSPEFAADPHTAYDRMRSRYGPLVPVEVAQGVSATLVIGYRAALRILSDPDRFPADSRGWQSSLPEHCPVLPLMEWGTVGSGAENEHRTRYRPAYLETLRAVDLFKLRREVEAVAVPLINEFCSAGQADLLDQYAVPLTMRVVNSVLGLSQEMGERVFVAMAALRDAPDAETSDRRNQSWNEILREAVATKRRDPGPDVISRLVSHPAGLDDTEIVAQLAVLYARGGEPTWNLIVNTVLLMLTDRQFHDDLLAGALTVRDAIDEVLFANPPLANSCARYPRQPQAVENAWLPVDQPVIISSTGCNSDPAVAGDRTGNRSHLAWGAGSRSCPAQSVAMVIVQEALDQLLDALPDFELAMPTDQLEWRTSAFHRAPVSVPVIFPPALPLAVP